MTRAKYSIISIIALTAIIGFATITAFSHEQQIQTTDITDSARAYGHFTLVVYDEFGVVKQYQQSDNLVVDNGLDCMGDLVFGTALCTGEAFYDYIEIGTGSTAPTIADTTIETPIGGCARVQDATVAGDTATPGEITATVESTFSGATCAATVTEAGVFDASTSGNMIARSTFAGVTVGASDTLTVTYNIKFD
jgi:hypothetical protein